METIINEDGLINSINKNNNNDEDNNKNNNEENNDNFKTKEDRLKYINNLYTLRPEGRIVKILKSPNKDKEQICKIEVEKKSIYASPIDELIPKISINRNNNKNKLGSPFKSKNFTTKEEFEREHPGFEKKYFLVKIEKYPITCKNPIGHIVTEIGTCGNIDVETEVLLRQYNVDYSDNFSNDIMEEIKTKMNEIQITDEYIKLTKRKDLRKEFIFTIDPYTSKDLDDAIHVKVIDEEKKLLEVGVHIADPTSYIDKGSFLDKEASNRVTSVYLVQKNIPMIPRILSESVCSILPKKDTLTLSCIFRVNLSTGILDESFKPEFCLSVVNSKAKWDYDLVQKIIDNIEVKYDDLKDEDGSKPENIEIFNELVKSVKILYDLTNLVSKHRYQSGSLIIDNDGIKFDLDPETKMPINFKIEKSNESHNLIKELMLIGNTLCANFIYEHLKEYSLIRRHPFFNDNKFNEIQKYFSINKINTLDFDDPQELNKLLLEMKKTNMNKYICIQHKLKFFMLRAEYVLAGQFSPEELKHFALNFDLYTHFTSPIRRYPDMIVHRQLKEIFRCLNGEINEKDYKEFEIYAPLMEQFNEKYNNGKQISQKSNRIFQCLYLRNIPSKYYTALIMDIIYKANNNNKRNNTNNNYLLGNDENEDETYLILFVPELNLELEWRKSDNEDIVFHKYDKNKNELYIDFKIDDSGLKNKYLRTFDAVQVELISVDSIPIDVKCKIDLTK